MTLGFDFSQWPEHDETKYYQRVFENNFVAQATAALVLACQEAGRESATAPAAPAAAASSSGTSAEPPYDLGSGASASMEKRGNGRGERDSSGFLIRLRYAGGRDDRASEYEESNDWMRKDGAN